MNKFDSKIILHNYILNKGEPTYLGSFLVYLMALIFTDFPMCSVENLWLSEAHVRMFDIPSGCTSITDENIGSAGGRIKTRRLELRGLAWAFF